MSEVKIRVHLLDYSATPPTVAGTIELDMDPRSTFEAALADLVRKPPTPLREYDTWDVGLIAGRTESKPAGIDYITPHWIVREDGSLEYCLTPHGLRRHTLGDVTRAVDLGLLDVSPSDFVVYPPTGTGGDGTQAILEWFFQSVGSEVIFGVGGYLARPYLRRLTWLPAVRRARRVAAAWADRQILSPYQLRVVVDRKPEWSAHELGRLLRVEPSVARNLLWSLGYEKNAMSNWQVGSSRKAIEKRARWMSAEPKDHLGNAFEISPRGLSVK